MKEQETFVQAIKDLKQLTRVAELRQLTKTEVSIAIALIHLIETTRERKHEQRD